MKRTLLLIFFLFLLMCKLTIGQETFSKVYYNHWNEGVQGHSIRKTHDENFIIIGETGLSQGLILKIDSTGSVVWSKGYLTTEGIPSLLAIEEINGGFIVGGHIEGSSVPDKRLFYMKIDSLGSVVWSKFVENFWYEGSCVKIERMNDGGFILIVNSEPLYGIPSLVKISSEGLYQWEMEYMDYFWIQSVKNAPGGGYYVLGTLLFPDQEDYRTMLFKVDTIGVPIWAKVVSTAENNGLMGIDLQVHPNGCVLALANYYSFILAKTDLEGIPIWGKNYPAYLDMETYVTSPSSHLLELDGNGFAYLMKGYSGGELIRVDSNGTPLPLKFLLFEAMDAVKTSHGGYMCMGNGPITGDKTRNLDTPQIGVYKLDSNGNSDGCNDEYDNDSDTTILSITPKALDYVSYCTMHDFTVTSSDYPLEIFIGCVQFYEGIALNKETQYLSVNPNPNSGIFQVSSNDQSGIRKLEVYNSQGKIIFSQDNITASSMNVDLTQTIPGIYLIRASTNQGWITTKMILMND